MMEVGPWRMDGKGGFKVQEGGWEEYITMVYSMFLLYCVLPSFVLMAACKSTSLLGQGSRTKTMTANMTIT
jgi:hypothetical protein